MGCRVKRCLCFISLIGFIGLIGTYDIEAKKIKQSLKVTKEKTSTSKTSSTKTIGQSDQKQLPADKNTYVTLKNGGQVEFCPDSISFSGYEKEASSSVETLLITNAGNVAITGVKIKIIYKDLKDRMLHSRTVTQSCYIPPFETRKIDIQSWDKQKSYFYYLGNEPKKVAIPYKVEIVPLAYFTYSS